MAETHPTESATTYDGIGKAYQEAFKIPAQIRSLEWLLSHLPPGARVLDVGSGTGSCKMLASAGHDVTGIDLTPKMVQIAKEQVPSAKFTVADARTWEPSPEEQPFNAVVSYFAMMEGVTPEDIRALFPRVQNWLRPGGLFIFGTVPLEHMDVGTNKWLGRSVTASSLTTEDLMATIEEAGLGIEKHELEGFMPNGVEAGLCKEEDLWEEQHVFVYAHKS